MFTAHQAAVLLLSLFCLVSITFSAGSADPADQRTTPAPLVSISKTAIPPRIDGVIEDNEWKGAAKFTGFISLGDGLAAAPQVHVAVTYDADNLYFAFDCPLDSEAAPSAAVHKRDENVWTDDSIELVLALEGRDPAKFYHFIGNCIGTIYDDYGRNRAWDGKWNYHTDAGMGWWKAELSISFAELETTDPTGQTWRMTIGRNTGKYLSWADTGRGYINIPKSGYLKFNGTAPVFQVKAIDGLLTGEISVAGRAFNPGDQAAHSYLGVRIVDNDSPPAWDDFPKKWRPIVHFNTAIGSWQDVNKTLVAADPKPKRLDIILKAPDGAHLFRQSIPFIPQEVHYVEFLAEPSEQKLFLRANLRSFAREFIDVSVALQHAQSDFKTELHHAALTGGKTHLFEHAINAWPLGTYDGTVRISDAGSGELLQEEKLSYQRIAAPEWYTIGKNVGISQKVLAPWTPVEWRDDTLAVYARQHDFQRSLLPRQIVAAEEPLLAGPISLRTFCNENEIEAVLETRQTITARDDTVITKAQGKLGQLQLDLTTTAEYDGMLKFELELKPSQPTRFDKIQLRIPFKPERALYYHISTHYYARSRSGLVPADGLVVSFKPFLWLGDDDRGLMWFAESTQGWSSNKTPIRVVPNGATTDMLIEFVNEPVTMTKPRRIVFGLQATPVKPVPTDYRAWRADWFYTPARSGRKFVDWEGMGVPLKWRYLWWHDAGVPAYMQGHNTPTQILPVLADHVKSAHDRGTPIITYFYLHGVNKITIDYDRYFPAWQTAKPREMAYWGRVIMGACPGSSMGDLFFYGVEKMVKDYGIDGIYFDGAGPGVPCNNPLHDHGWVDDEGRRHVIYPIFSLRRFYKRLATLLAEHTDHPTIWVHMDGSMTPPIISFTDANWEGEFVQGRMKGQGAYLSDIIPFDFYRAHALADQWGIPTMWLPSMFGAPEQRLRQARDVMAVVQLHGIPIGRTGQVPTDIFVPLWRAHADFGIDMAEFHGYWRNDHLVQVQPAHDRVLVSFYEKGGKKLIVVANFTTEPQDVTLNFTCPTSGSQLRDVTSDEVFSMANARAALPVPPKSFRMLMTQ